uniref:Uncharacterized protein n=1 Tax=Arundo donax TaxID=35708 RepID=A0A0A9ES31_ARUDO
MLGALISLSRRPLLNLRGSGKLRPVVVPRLSLGYSSSALC